METMFDNAKEEVWSDREPDLHPVGDSAAGRGLPDALKIALPTVRSLRHGNSSC